MAEVTIGDYTPPVKANPYSDAVDALIKAGDGKAATINVAADKVAKTRRSFGDAANAKGKTARLREKREQENGMVALVFTLGEKQNRPGRPANDAPAETVEVKAANGGEKSAKSSK